MQALIEDPKLWDKPEKAQALLKEKNKLEAAINRVRDAETQLKDNIDLLELAEAEGDAGVISEAEGHLKALQKVSHALEIESLLSGEVDGNDCYLEVNSGAGGTEACDWAQMLLRMYMRWAEAHNYKVSLIDRTDGEGAGIKSATVQIEGPNAYGWLKSENGVHRLVRISPFDSNARRHTSFSAITVTPVIDETINIEILDKDLRVDTYRASGAGGQHVNRTDSAVRITHNPTGIVVACQSERSQIQNRAHAMNMLRARLYEREMQARRAGKEASYDQKTDAGWGHQIRSYVLQPYQMIKDLRTEVENTDSAAVLDGDIDAFLHAALAQGV